MNEAGYLVRNYIVDNCPSDTVGVLLSGGIDSIMVAMSAHKAGKKVHAYTFYPDGYAENYDVVKASEVCKKMGWDLTLVCLKDASIKKDVDYLWEISQFSPRRQKAVDLVYPCYKVIPHVEQSVLLSGNGASVAHGSMLPSNQQDLTTLKYKRLYQINMTFELEAYMNYFSKDYGVSVKFPFLGYAFREYYLDKPYPEVYGEDGAKITFLKSHKEIEQFFPLKSVGHNEDTDENKRTDCYIRGYLDYKRKGRQYPAEHMPTMPIVLEGDESL